MIRSTKIDRQMIMGDTWRTFPSREYRDRITLDDAYQILNVPMEKAETFVLGQNGAQALKTKVVRRSDTGDVLAEAVGGKFHILKHTDMLEPISGLNDVRIEAVGTLGGGAVGFISVAIAEFRVPGDESPVIGRLLFYNPIGLGSFKVIPNTVRVYCDNVIPLILRGATISGNYVSFRHTESLGNRMAHVKRHILDTITVVENLRKLNERMAVAPLTVETLGKINGIIDRFHPVPSNAKARQTSVGSIVRQNLAAGIAAGSVRTVWDAYNVYTAAVDHRTVKRTVTPDARQWDAVTGFWAGRKEKILQEFASMVN